MLQRLKQNGGPSDTGKQDDSGDISELQSAAERAKMLLQQATEARVKKEAADNERKEQEKRDRARARLRNACCGCCY